MPYNDGCESVARFLSKNQVYICRSTLHRVLQSVVLLGYLSYTMEPDYVMISKEYSGGGYDNIHLFITDIVNIHRSASICCRRVK